MTQPARTETLLVRVLLKSLQAALDSVALEGAARQEHARAISELTLGFASFWAYEPLLTLTVEAGDVVWRGSPVLTRPEDTTGLIALLEEAAIRELALEPGVEVEEIHRLVEVLDRKRRLDVGGDLDLVTMLFEEEFDHIRYAVETVRAPPGPEGGDRADVGPSLAGIELAPVGMETPPPGTSPPEESGDAHRRREAVRADAETGRTERGIVRLEKFDSTLYFLDQREIEYLRTSIDRAYARDHAQDVLALLLDTIELQSDPPTRGEAIRVLSTMLPYLLGTGRFESIAYLTGELRTLTRTVDFDARDKAALDEIRVGISETRTLAQIFHALDAEEVAPTSRDLGMILRELRPEAMQTVLVWVSQLKSERAKRALVDAIEAFFTESPGSLARMVGAPDRTVVHRALGIASQLRLPELAEHVAPALDAEDSATRRLAVRALGAIGTSAALRAAVRVIDDPEPDVRKLVFQALAARPFRAARTRLAAVIGAADLERREVGERRALFEAFGAVAGPDGVPTLEPVLAGRGGVGRRPSPETRACAAVALGVIGTAAARFALERAAADRDPVVRTAASAALRRDRP